MESCEHVVQAKQGIAEADASIGLLHVQSELGLSDRGPLPPRPLVEAALQVNAGLSSLMPSMQHHNPVGLTMSSSSLAAWDPVPQRDMCPAQASRADSSASKPQPGSSAERAPHAAAVLLVFRILALAGHQLNGTARRVQQYLWRCPACCAC